MRLAVDIAYRYLCQRDCGEALVRPQARGLSGESQCSCPVSGGGPSLGQRAAPLLRFCNPAERSATVARAISRSCSTAPCRRRARPAAGRAAALRRLRRIRPHRMSKQASSLLLQSRRRGFAARFGSSRPTICPSSRSGWELFVHREIRDVSRFVDGTLAIAYEGDESRRLAADADFLRPRGLDSGCTRSADGSGQAAHSLRRASIELWC